MIEEISGKSELIFYSCSVCVLLGLLWVFFGPPRGKGGQGEGRSWRGALGISESSSRFLALLLINQSLQDRVSTIHLDWFIFQKLVLQIILQ